MALGHWTTYKLFILKNIWSHVVSSGTKKFVFGIEDQQISFGTTDY